MVSVVEMYGLQRCMVIGESSGLFKQFEMTLVVRIVQVSVYEMFRRYVSSSSAIAAECMHAGSYGEGTVAAGCIHVGSYREGSRG